MELILQQQSVFPTSLGWMGIQFSARGVRRVVFDRRSEADVRQLLGQHPNSTGRSELATSSYEMELDLGQLDDLQSRLEGYASGEPVALDDVPLDWEGTTEFQRRVLQACRQIPYGQVRTYGELAAAAGKPKAARAVGNVMAKNRWPILVPCHRVVGSQGALGGFSSRRGVSMKRRLLQMEQAT